MDKGAYSITNDDRNPARRSSNDWSIDVWQNSGARLMTSADIVGKRKISGPLHTNDFSPDFRFLTELAIW
jgi:hypothetical protein